MERDQANIAERIKEAAKNAKDQLIAEVVECQGDTDKLCVLALRYYQQGWNEGQRQMLKQYQQVLTRQMENINATIDTTRREADDAGRTD